MNPADGVEQILRCLRHQEVEGSPGAAMLSWNTLWRDEPGHDHTEPEPPVHDPFNGPNLVICTGRAHRLVLSLKWDTC
jgi:hypothetical protein